AIRAELDAAKSEEEELKTQVERASVLSGATSQYEAELKQLEREAQSNRALYESFLNRFKELREQHDTQLAAVQDQPVRGLHHRLPARHGRRHCGRKARPRVPLGLTGREGDRRR